jgi:hypothetical protein
MILDAVFVAIPLLSAHGAFEIPFILVSFARTEVLSRTTCRLIPPVSQARGDRLDISWHIRGSGRFTFDCVSRTGPGTG